MRAACRSRTRRPSRFCAAPPQDAVQHLPVIDPGNAPRVARQKRLDNRLRRQTKEEMARIVARIRRRWPYTRIVLCADSSFARKELMTWCEARGVECLFGLDRNKRLAACIADELAATKAGHRETAGPARQTAAGRARAFLMFPQLFSLEGAWGIARKLIGRPVKASVYPAPN